MLITRMETSAPLSTCQLCMPLQSAEPDNPVHVRSIACCSRRCVMSGGNLLVCRNILAVRTNMSFLLPAAQAQVIEINAEAVDAAISAVRAALAQGHSWADLERLIKARAP